MTLAGLILTDDDGQGESGVCRSLLRVAGQPLIEYQVRTARAAGAGHIVVLVDRLPQGLVEAFDRLRAEGANIDVARTARDAADRIHPDERVVVMSAGAISPAEVFSGHAQASEPVVFALPASETTEHLERIDGERRWTGLAVIPGSVLRSTAGMLGDWALAPTLLRAALQSGAKTEPAEDARMVRDERDAREASLALIGGGEAAGGLGMRHAIGPLASLAMPWLVARRFPFDLIAVMPLVWLGLAALTALLLWPAAAAALLLVGSFTATAAARLARVGARSTGLLDWHARLQPLAFLVTAASGAWLLLANGEGWGALALAIWGSVALYLKPEAARLRGWMADFESSALVLLAALVAGAPLIGLTIVLAHAVVSQFVLVRRQS